MPMILIAFRGAASEACAAAAAADGANKAGKIASANNSANRGMAWIAERGRNERGP